MLVRLDFRSLFFPKTAVRFLRFFCSSQLQKTPPALPELEPSVDADLISQLLLQHHNPFHAMESSLQLHGISFTPFLVHQTLLRLKHSSKVALSFFHYYQSHPNSSSLADTDTSTAFNLLIDILCKVRQFDVAWQLIIQMDQKSVKINFTTFYLLIRRLISAGFTRQAIRTFTEMHIFLDQQSEDEVWKSYFCYLLDSLCKYGYVKVATQVFNKEKWRLELNCKLYTSLIYGWCKVKNIEMARRFLGEMLEKGIDPNVISYNVLLNGICRRANLHPDGRFDKVIREAEKVFEEMTERGVEPDVTSYSILLHVYSRAHKPELSLEKLRIMRRKGICPNIVTYTSVIKCLCTCGRIEDAELLLEQMISNGVTPTSTTYNCFFKEFKGRKDVDGALRLYRKMKQGFLCTPSLSTFNILLGMLLKLGKIGLARNIWDDMKDSGAGPDLNSYTLLVHGFCEKQKWQMACEFFMEMIEKGFLPQKVTFETLYRGLIQSNMLRTWRRLKKRLDEESITFGSEFENYHLNPYRRHQRQKEGSKALVQAVMDDARHIKGDTLHLKGPLCTMNYMLLPLTTNLKEEHSPKRNNEMSQIESCSSKRWTKMPKWILKCILSTSIDNLEVQMGQVSQALNSRQKGALPSNTVTITLKVQRKENGKLTTKYKENPLPIPSCGEDE